MAQKRMEQLPRRRSLVCSFSPAVRPNRCERHGAVIAHPEGEHRRVQAASRGHLARRAQDDRQEPTSTTTRSTSARSPRTRHYLFAYYEYTGRRLRRRHGQDEEGQDHAGVVEADRPAAKAAADAERRANGGPSGRRCSTTTGRRTSRARSSPATARSSACPRRTSSPTRRCTRRSGPASWRPSTRSTSATTPSTWARSSRASTCCSATSSTSATTSTRDMAGMADEVTKLWWTYTDPLQVRLPGTPEGQQWKTMEEVFHTD